MITESYSLVRALFLINPLSAVILPSFLMDFVVSVKTQLSTACGLFAVKYYYSHFTYMRHTKALPQMQVTFLNRVNTLKSVGILL